MRSDEAIEELDQFMDRAILEGLGLVKVIHGRGTGVLRTMVRGHLINHPLVKGIRPGEGGTADGVTMVELN
jgi:DNA mismatch repair protein MutS2